MQLKIASYSLFEGADSNYNHLVDFAKAQNFDVVCLQEINGWQDDDFARLKDFTDRAGFSDYAYGNSNSDYKLATLADLPIKYQTNYQEGFWHCAVEVHVDFNGQELVIVNLNLDPFTEEPRLREISKLLGKLDLTKPTVVTGSLNSLSRLDGYGPEYFDELQKAGIFKYGQDKLDFEVTDKLVEAGLVDVATRFQQFEPTTPTAYPAGESEPPTRTDYCFVSQELIPLVVGFEVIKNDSTDKLSDHYPLALTLSDGAGVPLAGQAEAVPLQPVAEEGAQPDPDVGGLQVTEPAASGDLANNIGEDTGELDSPRIITNEDATEGEIDLH